MSNAVGLRDQRLRLYTMSEQGADGLARAVYTFLYERWGRLDESSAAVRAAQAKLQLKLDAAVEFDYSVDVPVNGVLKSPDGTMWWIRGINSTRQLRRVLVGVERVTEELAATFQVVEGDSVLDGAHMVDPAS